MEAEEEEEERVLVADGRARMALSGEREGGREYNN